VLCRSQISRGICDPVSIEPLAVDSANFNMAKPKAHGP
jgi:hypothetical protein